MRAHSHARTLPNPAALGPDIEEGAVNRPTNPPLAFPRPGIGLVRIRQINSPYHTNVSKSIPSSSVDTQIPLAGNVALATKKHCYVVSCLSVYFLPPQRRRAIQAIGWEVQSSQHFRRSREFMSLNFRMLILCYHYIIDYAAFTRILLMQRSDIIWFYDSQYLSCSLK